MATKSTTSVHWGSVSSFFNSLTRARESRPTKKRSPLQDTKADIGLGNEADRPRHPRSVTSKSASSMPRSKSRDSNHFSIKSASRQDSQHRQTLSRSTSARTRKERHEVIESSFVYEKHDQYSLSPLLKQNEDDNLEGKINQYLILREIGSGAYGKVNLCKSENDRRYYACKVVSKSKLKKKFRWNCTPMLGPRSMVTEKEVDPIQNIRREVAILKKLSKHPNINALVEVLDDENDDNLYMFFELCEYGPVMVIKIHERPRPFSESLARVYFRDVLLGIEYLHKNRIIHRDIKPENLLLTLEQTIQIADFGISHMFNEGEDDRIVDKNTSPLFCPPEACQMESGSSTIIKGFPFDVWSMGVTLFCFVHGYCPFEDECIPDLYSKICQDEPRLSRDLSPELTALLSDMLNKDPEQRATLKQIRDHSWVTDNGTEPLISEEENCILEVSVTDEDIENAVSPGRKLINQVKKMFKKVTSKMALKTPPVEDPTSSITGSHETSASRSIPVANSPFQAGLRSLQKSGSDILHRQKSETNYILSQTASSSSKTLVPTNESRKPPLMAKQLSDITGASLKHIPRATQHQPPQRSTTNKSDFLTVPSTFFS